jgi:hypothetical protein
VRFETTAPFPQPTTRVLRAAATFALLASIACSDGAPAAMSPATSAMLPPPSAGIVAPPSAGAGTPAPAGAGSGAAAGTGAGGVQARDGGLPDASIACRIPDDLALTGEDADGGVDPKCVDIPRTIFAENCIGGFCHNARARPSGNLDLMSPCVADRLLDVRSTCDSLLLVDREHAARSFLLDKLQNMKPRCGASMPDGWWLPPDQVACVTAWVNAVIRASR